MRKIGVELFNTEKAEAQPLATKKKKRFMKMLKIVVFVKNFSIIRKKVSTTQILKKLKIIIITMKYKEVQHIQYANLNTQHKEIHLL